jgi:two-component system nitrogen regulation sensor histidine kinase NtrY
VAVRVAHWELAAAVAAGLLAGWLIHPGLALAVAAAGAGLAAAVLAARRRPFVGLILVALAAVGAGGAAHTSHRVQQIETTWSADSTGIHWRLIAAAGRRLNTDLASAVGLARSLAEAGVASATGARAAAFARLAEAAEGDGPERGVVVLDAEGRPWAWSGRHRMSPRPVVGLEARITPFYVILSAGRQGPDGTFSVAHVVLNADSAVPDRQQTLAARFARASGVGLEFYPPGRGPYWADVFDYCVPACGSREVVPDTLFSVRLVSPTQGAFKLDTLAAGSGWVAAAAALLLLTLLLAAAPVMRGVAAVGLAALLVFTPAGRHAPLGQLFSPGTFYADLLGPASASAGALIATASLVLVAGAALRRARWIPPAAGPFGGLLALGVPLVLNALAHGITPPTDGTGLTLWLQWEVALALTAAAMLVVGGSLVRRVVPGEPPRWLPLVGAAWVIVVAVVGLWLWAPARGWTWWYLLLWLPGLVLAVLPASPGRAIPLIAVVGGALAAVLTWGAVAHGRVALAERDAEGLRQGGDPVAVGLLERFGASLQEEATPHTPGELYSRWSRSALEADRYPAVLAAWSPAGTLESRLDLAALSLPDSVLRAVALAARDRHVPAVTTLPGVPARQYVLSVPFPDGSAVTVGLGPRSRLIEPVRVAQFLRGVGALAPPYTLTLSDIVAAPDTVVRGSVAWQRDGWVARGDTYLTFPDGVRYLHAAVPLGNPLGLLVRGALALVLNLLLVGALWLVAHGIAGRLRVPRVVVELVGARSYRGRLGLAFAVFFVMPTVGYSAWTATRLGLEAQRSRDLVIRQTLADAAGSVRDVVAVPRLVAREQLQQAAARLNADLLLYQEGQLRQASAPVLVDLGVLEWYLPPPVERALTTGDEVELAVNQRIAGRPTRVGYRGIGGALGDQEVLGAPRLQEDPGLVRSEQDLVFGLLLITLGGLAAAAGLAGLAARSLARPVQALRAAAEQVRRGELPSPFGPGAPGEFVPVMDAFDRMARDVHASRAALEAQRQRTAAVLRNVGTGVVALDDALAVVISNPRADEILGQTLAAGASVEQLTGVRWRPLWAWVREVAEARAGEEPREFTIGDRQIRARVAQLTGPASGWVVALDDVTDLARAVRVLAWGELARQIAHEIKNPLTPIRLGVQHLRRAYRTPRGDYDEVLDRTSRQILAEIERLDAIARAFSRFGAPPSGAEPLGRVDAVEVVRDTAGLYALADGAGVRVEADGLVPVLARPDELKEVLINLIENARAAGASAIVLTVAAPEGTPVLVVRDNGHGMPAEHLARLFEPQFSTTTSGTGLGLAICRRLVESWGGRIMVESAPAAGTTVRVELVPATG